MTRFKILLFSLSSCIGSLFAQQMKEPAETIETNKILTIQSIILDEERAVVCEPTGRIRYNNF